jgi:hypothetical protein
MAIAPHKRKHGDVEAPLPQPASSPSSSLDPGSSLDCPTASDSSPTKRLRTESTSAAASSSSQQSHPHASTPSPPTPNSPSSSACAGTNSYFTGPNTASICGSSPTPATASSSAVPTPILVRTASAPGPDSSIATMAVMPGVMAAAAASSSHTPVLSHTSPAIHGGDGPPPISPCWHFHTGSTPTHAHATAATSSSAASAAATPTRAPLASASAPSVPSASPCAARQAKQASSAGLTPVLHDSLPNAIDDWSKLQTKLKGIFDAPLCCLLCAAPLFVCVVRGHFKSLNVRDFMCAAQGDAWLCFWIMTAR